MWCYTHVTRPNAVTPSTSPLAHNVRTCGMPSPRVAGAPSKKVAYPEINNHIQDSVEPARTTLQMLEQLDGPKSRGQPVCKLALKHKDNSSTLNN